MEQAWLHIPDAVKAAAPGRAIAIEAYVATFSDPKLGESAVPESAIVSSPESIALATQATNRFGTGVNVVLIGIGGSSLAVEAVYAALQFRTQGLGELIVLDTVEYARVARLAERLKEPAFRNRTVCVVASKSGKTLETLWNADLLFTLVPEMRERAIAISVRESPLFERAIDSGLLTLAATPHISGRMCALNETALVPLALLGVDIGAYTKGAQEGVAKAVERVPYNAAVYDGLFSAGYRVHELLVRDASLSTLCRWWRQLVSESLGKAVAHEKAVGFVPDGTVATTDFHSVLQLRLAGPHHTLSTLVTFADDESAITVPTNESLLGGTHPVYAGKSQSDLYAAIMGGVLQSYRDAGIPLSEVSLGPVGPHSLGAFIAWSLADVMALAKLWDVNAFDQPAVEAYKAHAHTKLNGIY
jgi:glucose-6-phosphate isomerase